LSKLRSRLNLNQRAVIDYCPDCFEKQQKIDTLEERVKQLEAQLRYRNKKDNQPYFGSSTPSAKLPVKENSAEENRNKKGGAKLGHSGNGRSSIKTKDADEIISLDNADLSCPNCGSKNYEQIISRTRSVIDMALVKAQNFLYTWHKNKCRKCGTLFEPRPTMLPKSLYGNKLITNACVLHFLQGIPAGRIISTLGDIIDYGALFNIFHRLANFWLPAYEKLVNDYKQSPVKHADETGWRNDGFSGYSWIFCSENTTVFAFRNSRSAAVLSAVLGTERLPGVLVVDRYAAYNKVNVEIQYCYAHLLRSLKDLQEEFYDNNEVNTFVDDLAPLLADAMHLQKYKTLSNKKYYQKAKQIKKRIMQCIRAPAKHCGIQSYQDIFKDKEKRMFHWATNRLVPADNNRAERECRPTVIARKVSFGSQSEKGANTREILMSVLHTARKRLKDKSIEDWFVWTLEKFIKNSKVDPYSLIPKS